MKKMTLLIGCFFAVMFGNDNVMAMNSNNQLQVKSQSSNIYGAFNGSRFFKTEDELVSSLFELQTINDSKLADLVNGSIDGISKNMQAIVMLQAYMIETIRRNLNYIHPDYVDNVVKSLNKIDKATSVDQKNKLKNLNKSLNSLLETRNTIFKLLKMEKKKFHNSFVDFDNPLLEGVLYMLQYVEKEKISSIAHSYKIVSTRLSNATNKHLFKQISDALTKFVSTIDDISRHTETFIHEANNETSPLIPEKLVQQPNLRHLSRAAKNKK